MQAVLRPPRRAKGKEGSPAELHGKEVMALEEPVEDEQEDMQRATDLEDNNEVDRQFMGCQITGGKRMSARTKPGRMKH
jgi:hypothetical protein